MGKLLLTHTCMGRIIDISHTLYTGMPSIPSKNHVATEVKEISNIDRDGIERHQILMSCHTGTHMDAPIHMVSGGLSLDQIPLSHFSGTVKKFRVAKNSGEVVDVSDISGHDFSGLDFVILETGWESEWEKGSLYYKDHPALSEATIEFLMRQSTLKGILIDLPSPDVYDSHEYPVHKIWFQKKHVLVENVCNLAALEQDRAYTVVIAPLNLLDVEASPVRCFVFEQE